MALTRLQLFEEYTKKVAASLTATRIDAAVSTSSQEASILTDIKQDLVAALSTSKNNIQLVQASVNLNYNNQIAEIDQQIADIQAVT